MAILPMEFLICDRFVRFLCNGIIVKWVARSIVFLANALLSALGI